MKRVNPKTGLNFKWGDVRDDGKVFIGYNKSSITKRTGYFKEDWVNPESFKKKLEYIKTRKRTHPEYWSEYSKTTIGRAKKLVKAAHLRAKKKHLDFDLAWEEIQKVLIEGKCQLTGFPFILDQVSKFQNNPFAPSIDRIDPKKGYLKNNIRVILHSLNSALNEYGTDHLIKIVDAMKENLHGKKASI